MLINLAALLVAFSVHTTHTGHCVGQDTRALQANADAAYYNQRGQIWVHSKENKRGPYVFCYVGFLEGKGK